MWILFCRILYACRCRNCNEVGLFVYFCQMFRTSCAFHFLYRYVNGTRLDDRLIRVDWDAGFVEGRQYGRGKTGGQVRDEYRTDYDAGRGGYGKLLSQKLEIVPKI